jgi:hypothetical protein
MITKNKYQVFILDDARSIQQACRDARWAPNATFGEVTLIRPFRWNGEVIEYTLEDAMDIIRNNSRYDFWILDNDLGPGLEGFTFLKEMCELQPDKIPEYVLSCSANPSRREAIEAYHQNWWKASKMK